MIRLLKQYSNTPRESKKPVLKNSFSRSAWTLVLCNLSSKTKEMEWTLASAIQQECRHLTKIMWPILIDQSMLSMNLTLINFNKSPMKFASMIDWIFSSSPKALKEPTKLPRQRSGIPQSTPSLISLKILEARSWLQSVRSNQRSLIYLHQTISFQRTLMFSSQMSLTQARCKSLSNGTTPISGTKKTINSKDQRPLLTWSFIPMTVTLAITTKPEFSRQCGKTSKTSIWESSTTWQTVPTFTSLWTLCTTT